MSDTNAGIADALRKVMGVTLVIMVAAPWACGPPNAPADEAPGGAIELFDGRLIPAMPELLGLRAQYDLRLEWLAQKHAVLLDLMREHGIDMWIVVSEEFHPDAVIQYVAPPLHYTRRRDVLVFVDDGSDQVAAYSDYWRPTADYARFIEPFPSAPKRPWHPGHRIRPSGPLGAVPAIDDRAEHGGATVATTAG